MAGMHKRRSLLSQKPISHKFVFWDVDPTGRRLIDEICQLAAFTPDSSFKQYIMPNRDVDMISKKKHQIKTVTVGRYRVLKETKQDEVLKTKSELYALLDFLMWLESFKDSNEPIVLITFEQYKLAPCLLIEALKRYKLLPKFNVLVSGFANAYPYVKEKCELSMSSFSLRTLAKVLLNKEQEETFSAYNRAKLSYEIVEHLCAGDSDDSMHPIMKAVMPYFSSVENEESEIFEFKLLLEKQNTLKPIFISLLRDPNTRKRASFLRSYLTNSKIYFDDLKPLWDENKTIEVIDLFLTEKITFASCADKLELMSIIEEFFKSNEGVDKSEVDVPSRGFYKRTFRKNKRLTKTPIFPICPRNNNVTEPSN